MNKQEFLKELENKLVAGEISYQGVLKAKFLLSLEKERNIKCVEIERINYE